MRNEELRMRIKRNSFVFFFVSNVEKSNRMEIKELYEIYKAHPVVTTDSRNCPERSIFFALKGGTFDGNKFAVAALEKGCAYAVVDDLSQCTMYNAQCTIDIPLSPADSSPNLGELSEDIQSRLIVVKNVLEALQQLARYHREQLGIPVVGITGTNGKTTTKELVAAVLSRKYRVQYTQGNFNNHIGVPLTLLSIRPDCEIAVVEMGANHPGEIRDLAKLALPTCGLITNVGKAHLEGFGSLEGVINTKKELYDNIVARGGHVFLNAGTELLVEALKEITDYRLQITDNLLTDKNISRTEYTEYTEVDLSPCDKSQVTTYSSNSDVVAEVNGRLLRCAPYVEFEWNLNNAQCTMHNAQLSTHFVGAYNLDNMLAAITVGLHFGVERKDICAAISEYMPANNRSQLTKTERNTLIVDAYNANPTSMMAAIDNFDIMEGEHKMAILGDMLELGEQSEIEHQNIVRRLMDSKIERIILVGKEFSKCTIHNAQCTIDRRFKVFEFKSEELESQLSTLNSQLILLKGSNGIGLYKLIPYL